MLLCRLWHVVTHVLRLAQANLPISSPVQTLDFPPCVNSFQFREGNVEIRSVPSSGRPGAQLGHHILVRHWLIFTFDSDRNGTWKDGGHKYLLAKKLEGIEIKEGRPDLKTFQAGMSKIKGCAGLDGWNKEEMKVIGKCQGAVRLIWQTMAMWESYNCIPSAVNHCKLVHLAKKPRRVLPGGHFRPVAILSVWWRAWSATWIGSNMVRQWTEHTFPPEIAGGLPGAHGPELMSALISYKVQLHRHAISLDFKHAFDCVDIGLMEEILVKLLPRHCSRWHSLLTKQWASMSRWVCYDSAVNDNPIHSNAGLPQGDPAAPLFMTLLVYGLSKMVEDEVQKEVIHYIYMDDRTAIANSQADLDDIQESWQKAAEEYHLLENTDKAQRMQSGEECSSMEVLGLMIGSPSKSKWEESRTMRRLQDCGKLYRKLGILPTTLNTKLLDSGVYGRPLTAYGWIEQIPDKKWIKQLDTMLWKAVGRTQYTNPHMRQIFGGTLSSLSVTPVFRQIRLLAQRDQFLLAEGIHVQESILEDNIQRQLAELGWAKDGGQYRHAVLGYNFCLRDQFDQKVWKRTAHLIRESFRALHFRLYRESGRHEVVNVGDYEPKRRELALKWAAKDSVALMLVFGGIQSPLLRHKYRGDNQRCPCCNELAPHWEHLWKCFTKTDPPEDGLLLRNLWPRKESDFRLCDMFMEGMKQVKEVY